MGGLPSRPYGPCPPTRGFSNVLWSARNRPRPRPARSSGGVAADPKPPSRPRSVKPEHNIKRILVAAERDLATLEVELHNIKDMG